ncbi:MAG: carboxypeptidase-like regulatory domain-containing protein [Myxococcales bacterium]|nr:carboxypeptidase-like regulatory domain-containing protein [Myxococcales bacterium]
MRWWAAAVLWAGCSGAPTSSVDVEPVDTGHEALPTMTGPTGSVSGWVRDAEGVPLKGAKVSMCAEICITTDSDADGAFEIGVLPVVPHAFHVRVVDDLQLASPMVPVQVIEGEEQLFDVVVPRMSDAVALPLKASELQPTAGLHVTAALGHLTSVFGEAPESIAALQVPEAQWPPLQDLEGTVRAVFYLTPYDAEAEPALAFRIDVEAGVATDRSLQAWVAGYSEQRWLDAGRLEPGVGGLEGGSLPLLTTLVLVEPE